MRIQAKIKEINKMIEQATSVFLMAHRDLDLDAINSCIGMDFYVKSKKKKSYIIIDDEEQELGVKKVLEVERKKINVIRSRHLNTYRDENSLLIVLDTSKSKITQNPDVIYEFNKVINIDHHDVSRESLRCDLRVIDEDVSSTCEMITNFLRENNMKITRRLATLLLSGIVLDTNNFRLKTSSETFYIAYYLMMCGANMNDVNELLKQNIHDYIKRQKIISSVKVVRGIAIGRGLQRSEYKKEEIAKSADSLLTFSKIKASFVIANISKNEIGISGRSTGEINVGKILEQFGGGGDENEGAAQIENSNVKKTMEELLKIIRNL